MTPVTAAPTLNAREVERALGIPYWKVVELLTRGELRGTKTAEGQGGEWRVARAEVEKARRQLLGRIKSATDANAIAKALTDWLRIEEEAVVDELMSALAMAF